MRKTILPILGLALLLVTTGCMHWINPPVPDEGFVRVTIVRAPVSAQGVSPKWIPLQADKVRVRIWHPDTGTNVIRTITIQTSSQTVAIPVPAGDGYDVDAVAYFGARDIALTGARVPQVAIRRGKTTNVRLQLARWHSGFDKTTVQSGEVYSLTCDLGGSAGPTEAIFDYGLLYIYSTQTGSATWESSAIVQNGKVVLTGHAPSVDKPTPMYALVKIALRPEWRDPDDDNNRLWLEMPALMLGEMLHEITVLPPGGNVNVVISSK